MYVRTQEAVTKAPEPQLEGRYLQAHLMNPLAGFGGLVEDVGNSQN